MVEIPVPSERPWAGKGPGAAALIVVLVAAVAYAATLGYELVWDDTLLIQQSWRLHDWRQLPALLTAHFWAEVGEASQYYRPLITLTFFVDLQVWGLRPLGFHLTNVLAHVAATLAVLVVARRVVDGELAAAVCAVAFALHPLHTESVSFVSGRTDVIAALFFLLALIAYDRGLDEARWRWMGWSLVAYLLAALAKEVAITLPLVLGLWDRLVRGDLRGRDAVSRAAGRYAAYAAVAGVYFALRTLALGGLAETSAAGWGSLVTRVLTTVTITARYVWLTVVPYPSSAFYAVAPDTVPPGPVWWLAAAALVAALGVTIWAARRAPAAGFGACWFWVTVAPSGLVNLLPLPSPIMAERFLYLPSVGFCLVVGWVAGRFLGVSGSGRALTVLPLPSLALAAGLLAYAVLTLWRNEDWRDEHRLYSRMVETSPTAALPLINLAFVEMPRGEIASANRHLREAVRLAPGNPRAHAGLGVTETMLGDRDAGLRHGLQARALAPGNPDVRASLGALYLQRGEPAEALPELTESLRLKPNQVHAALNRALALAWLGRRPEALAQLDRALVLVRLTSPDLPLADRITAEVLAGHDPVGARAAWDRYTARLRAAGQLTPAVAADLGRVEERLEALSVKSADQRRD
jgi:tetratricopeptide (TPR) repeat protein